MCVLISLVTGMMVLWSTKYQYIGLLNLHHHNIHHGSSVIYKYIHVDINICIYLYIYHLSN